MIQRGIERAVRKIIAVNPLESQKKG